MDEGYNLIPTEINAAFGIHQLNKIKDFSDKIKFLSKSFYNGVAKFKNVRLQEIIDGCDPCFMALPIKIKSDNLKDKRIFNIKKRKVLNLNH